MTKHILKSADRLSGDDWLNLTKPCVYIWFKGKRCLYVGQSANGIIRVMSASHHVINVVEAVLPSDHFHIYWLTNTTVIDGLELTARLLQEESRFIKKYQPVYNLAGRFYEQKEKSNLQPNQLLSLQKNIQAHTDLADVLFNDMSNKSFLGDPRSCQEKSSIELEKQLAEVRQFSQDLNRLQKLDKAIKQKR